MIDFLRLTAWEMTPPSPYGAFHLTFWIVGLSLSIFAAIMLRRINEKKNRWLIFGIGLFLLISELYKQLFYTYVVGEGSYQYDRIPFQLCSIPMYVCLIVPWLKEGKAKRALYTFTGSFGFMGGFVSYFSPESMCLPYWTLTIHSFTWHMILIFLGLYLFTTGRAGKSFRDFMPAVGVYLSCCAVAFAVNLLCYDLPGADVNLFYLGPKPSPLIICRDIVRTLGWECNAVLYCAAIIVSAWLFYTAYLFCYKTAVERTAGRDEVGASQSMYAEVRRRAVNLKKPALYFYGRHISYSRMFYQMERVSEALSGMGIDRGDTITLALPNMPLAPYLFYGANRLGITVNLVHPLEPFEKLKGYAVQTQSKAVFVFDELAERWASEWEQFPCAVVFCSVTDNISDFESVFYRLAFGRRRRRVASLEKNAHLMEYFSFLEKGEGAPLPAAEKDADLVAAVMHSGGTTGQAKSVLLTNGALNTAGKAIINAVNGETLGEREKLSAVLPMFHAFGLGVGFHCAFLFGYESVLIPRYSPRKIAAYIAAGKITVMAGVPTMYKGIVAEPRFDCPKLKNLTAAFCGGDRLDDPVRLKMNELIERRGGTCRLYEGYGITEAAGVYSVNKRGAEREGSVGRPLCKAYQAEAYIDGKRQPRGVTGEICLSSPSLMKGYLGGDSSALFHDRGALWLKTGDIGYVDQDGYLFFREREKRIVKVSGVNVFPSEVESVLAEDPAVGSVGVKAAADEKKGHILVAFIERKKVSETEEETLARIRAAASVHLNKWSQPKRYVFLEKLPLTSFGKVDYDRLKE